MFELSVLRNTSSWDILALLLAAHRLPRFRNLFRVVLLKLMQNFNLLEKDQQKLYWRKIESIKAAIYRSAKNMEVNYANTQIRLQLSYVTEVAKGLLRGSIRSLPS